MKRNLHLYLIQTTLLYYRCTSYIHHSLRMNAPSSSHIFYSKLLPTTSEGLDTAALLIQQGKLVAFPTETVYGLGADALNVEAVYSIFKAKGRPLTDPLIVHVCSQQQAKSLLVLTSEEESVFDCLSAKFWPGPLTLIAKSSPLIPLPVTANTGFVGIRWPDHPIALQLLQKCQLPIAAPSANRFAHVSPTRAVHVLNDLGMHDIHVIDGDNDAYQLDTCKHGIESTVLKINEYEKALQIYRHGAVTKSDIERVLSDNNIHNWTVTIVSRIVPLTVAPKETTDVTVGEEAPGQAITHYSPDVPCYVISQATLLTQPSDDSISSDTLHHAVLLDYAGTLSALYPFILDCRDLSPSGDIAEAARNLFDYLRWAETVPGAKNVYVTEISTTISGSGPTSSGVNSSGTSSSTASGNSVDALCYGVMDRIHRASSGKTLTLRIHVN